MACVAASSLWFVMRVCPHCHCHGLRNPPSLYCAIAGRVAAKGDASRFAASFRRNTKVIAIGWVLPPVGGVVLAVQTCGRWWSFAGHIAMLAAFCLIAFWLLPAASKVGCDRCVNRANCPRARACDGGTEEL